VEPVRILAVNSQAAGIVQAVRAEEGSRISQDDVLVELDDRESRAQLRRAQAVLANAKAAFDRAEALKNNRIISDVEYEQARAAYEVAASDVSLWETRVSFTRILAPTAGVVIAKSVETGNSVSANQLLFQIADVSLLVVRVQVSELDVVNLHAGTPAMVQLDAFPNRDLGGTIRRVFPSADPVSRLVPVEVALRSVPVGVDVRSGFLARVTFPLESRQDVLVVPASAVNVSETGPYVFLVQGDTLVRRDISIGLSTEGVVESTAGLEEGEVVVTSGQAGLRPGMTVSVQGRDAS